MNRYHSYLNSAVSILEKYNGSEPFASFLKKYFARHKKFGSKDRKQVGHLCYCYFRLGKSLRGVTIAERILIALFLCSGQSNDILKELKPEWDEQSALVFTGKVQLTGYSINATDIFPWENELSEGIDAEAFSLSHFEQPDLFLRLRPGKEKKVREKLEAAGIAFRDVAKDGIALFNSSKLGGVVEPDRDAVVQDLSSQRVGELMYLVGRGLQDGGHLVRPGRSDQMRVWDCCAASGGKSIMARDILGDIELFVSDVRESILINLEDRFERAGMENYEMFVADLSKPQVNFLPSFNLIIADVPCTGSGTWGRTPEQLFYFDPKKIATYAALQRQIVQTVVAQAEPGGYILYITCSVFKKENEEQVAFIKEKFHLELVRMEFFKGYNQKADTLFAALLKKPL